jgi:hypothetical protein
VTYQRRREQGICTKSETHGPAEPGKHLCAPCLVDKRFDQREAYRVRRPEKRRTLTCMRCTREGHNSQSCTSPPISGGESARRKNERERRYRKALKQRGFCVNGEAHPRPETGRTLCVECLKKRKAKL